MNLVSKLILFSSVALLLAMMVSGCGSVEQPIFTDNPNPSAPGIATGSGTETGSGSGTGTGTTSETGTGTQAGTGAGTGTGSVMGSQMPATDLSSIPNTAPRFQTGETVTISTSTGSDMYPGPIPAPGQSYLIADDGTISLPLVGSVKAAGTTPGELQDAVEKRYVPQYFVRLAVTVTAPNRYYYVGGEVTHPGPEVYIGVTSVTTAIQTAGDLTQFASHKIWLKRTDGTRIRVNVDKALRDSTDDPPVYPGDQIQVPRRYF